MRTCSKCGGQLEPISRHGQMVFYFCRPCALPHDQDSNPIVTASGLKDFFSPADKAREFIGKHRRDAGPVARTALEVALMQQLFDAYMTGLKEGVLLAYSQDVTEGEPMEKLGVSTEELLKELRDQYNHLKENQKNALEKEASARIQVELDSIKEKIDQISSENN